MRVLITVPFGARLGGAEEMLWSFLQRVDRGRVDPVCVFFERGPLEHEVASLGLDTAVVETGRMREIPRGAASIAALARLIRRSRPALVLNWMSKSQLYGALAAKGAGLGGRVVWWQHGVPHGTWLDRLATALPAVAIGCSSATSSRAQRLLRPRRRTFVVHPGVAVPAPRPAGTDSLRDDLGIPAGATVLGIFGRLQAWKGQDRFIHAVALLRGSGYDVHGLIVGGDANRLEPGYAASLAPLAARLGIARHVTMTGHVPDVQPYLAVLDLLVSASAVEPFGIGVLEAMAAGIPVLAVNGGGPSEFIDSGRTGLLVDAEDPVSLANGAASLIDDPAMRKRLSAAAQARVAHDYSVTAMVERLTRELESLHAEVQSVHPGYP